MVGPHISTCTQLHRNQRDHGRKERCTLVMLGEVMRRLLAGMLYEKQLVHAEGKNTAMNRSAAINAIVKIEALLVQASKNRWILQRILPGQSVQRKKQAK